MPCIPPALALTRALGFPGFPGDYASPVFYLKGQVITPLEYTPTDDIIDKTAIS